MVEGKLL